MPMMDMLDVDRKFEKRSSGGEARGGYIPNSEKARQGVAQGQVVATPP